MDIEDKVIKALREPLGAEYIRLEDDDGITGFVVSPRFKGVSSLDRQLLIDDALRNAPVLSPQERRRVLMIAGLTPAEYDTVGAEILVPKVKSLAGGVIEVLVRGNWSDAEYVRGALNNLKGVQTTDPKPAARQPGVVMSFRANGSESNPLTKDKVIRLLKRQPYVSVALDD